MGPSSSQSNINLVDLWMHFQDRGAAVKASMVGVVSWLLGFSAVLVGYAVDKAFSFDPSPAVARPWVAVIAGVSGLMLTWYSLIVLGDFDRHIDRSFSTADMILADLRAMFPYLGLDPEKDVPAYKGSGLAGRLRIFVLAFGALFGALALIGGLALVYR